MAATSIAALPYPALTDTPNGAAQIQSLAQAVDTVVIPRFATTAARDAAITSPVAGQECWTTTPATFWHYSGTAWVPRAQRGTTAVALSGVAAVTGTVTYGYAFPVAPTINLVSLTIGSSTDSGVNPTTTPTTTGFSWRAWTRSGGNGAASGTLHWYAAA